MPVFIIPSAAKRHECLETEEPYRSVHRPGWEVRAEAARRRLLVALGLWPMPTPARAVIRGKVDRDGYTVEKVYLGMSGSGLQTWQGECLLQIDNAHAARCGPAPSLDASDEYVGYFENDSVEQWVFIGDPETGNARLFGGDVNWENWTARGDWRMRGSGCGRVTDRAGRWWGRTQSGTR